MKYIVTINGKKYEVEVERASGSEQEVVQEAPKANVSSQPSAGVSGADSGIEAPMPGTILDVKVAPGQRVKQGDVLFVLEAMKMENEILAPKDSVVKTVTVSKGAAVNTGDILAVLQ